MYSLLDLNSSLNALVSDIKVRYLSASPVLR